MWPVRAPTIIVHLCLVFGDKLVDPDITGGRRAGGSNRVSELVSDEVRSAMMMAIPGVPGEDYPILSSEELPSVLSNSQFSCKEKEFGGYFADTSPASRCQVFHVCGQRRSVTNLNTFYSFLCPNGTIFNQQYFVCDWWFNVDCDKTEQFYSLNEELDNARQSTAQDRSFDTDIKKVKRKIIDVQQPSQGSQSAVGRGSGLRQSPAQELITLHTLYGAPESEAQYGGQELYSYQRPSRDLQFNYVNTAKKEGEKFIDMKEEPSAQEILETLVRLVSPEDLDDLYIR